MASYTSTQNGNWNDSATWGGGGVPGDGDDATINGHSVTMTASVTLGTAGATGTDELTIQAAGTLTMNTNVVLTMKRDIRITGASTIAMLAGSGISFANTYRIRYDAASNIWTMSGTSANKCTITAQAGHWYLVNEDGSSAIDVTWNNFEISNCGAAGTVGITIRGDFDVAGDKNWSVTNGLITNYGGVKWDGAYDSSSQITFDGVSFVAPVGTYAMEFNQNRVFDAGKRVLKNCTFAISGTTKTLRVRGTNSSVNPILLQNNISENIIWDLGTLCTWSGVAHIDLTSNPTIIRYNEDPTVIVNVEDSVIAANQSSNAHLISGAGIGIKNMSDSFLIDGYEGVDPATEANLILIDGDGSTWNLNGVVGIDGSLATSLNAVSSTINIEQCTHVVQSSISAASFYRFETSNPTGGSINIKNSIYSVLVTPAANNQYFARSSVVGGSDFLTSVDYNNVDSNITLAVGMYSDCSVTGKNFGDPGWDQNSLNVDSNFIAGTRNVKTWDTSLSGAGTQENAIDELLKRNGYDKTGSSDTYNSSYSISALLTYLRAGFAPTNSALRGAGDGGVDIGAIGVQDPPVSSESVDDKSNFVIGLGMSM